VPTLEIRNLHASVETTDGMKPILHGVDLSIGDGEIHAIMGPNGSGKSTTAYALAGHPKYCITEGQVFLDGEEITDMTPDERAQAGLFLAMQYPVEVPGVSVTNFLRTAKTAIDGEAHGVPHLRSRLPLVDQARHLSLEKCGGLEIRQLEVGGAVVGVLEVDDARSRLGARRGLAAPLGALDEDGPGGAQRRRQLLVRNAGEVVAAVAGFHGCPCRRRRDFTLPQCEG